MNASKFENKFAKSVKALNSITCHIFLITFQTAIVYFFAGLQYNAEIMWRGICRFFGYYFSVMKYPTFRSIYVQKVF